MKKAKKPIKSDHIRAIARPLWLLYLNSAQIRLYFAYIALTKKYPRQNICIGRCKTYASRKRCEHIMYSPWTRVGTSFATTICLLIAAQLAYPSDRALPLARLQGHGFVGFKTHADIAKLVGDLDKKDIAIYTKTGVTKTTYSEMGIAVDVDGTFENLRTYRPAEKIVPFSIVFMGNESLPVHRQVDSRKLEEFIKQLTSNAATKPQDAGISLDGSKLLIVPAEDGYEYQKETIKQQFLRANPGDTSITLAPTLLLPRISSQTATEKARQMQKRIDTPLIIRAADQSLKADSATLASWIDITPKPEEGDIQIVFNRGRVENFLRPLISSIEHPAKSETVTLLNGLMAGSSPGSSGRSLNFSQLVDEVANSTNAGTATVWAKVNSILPNQTYDRRYSRDSQGIQSLIDYWAQTHSGQHGIDFRTINGRISAGTNSYKQFTAASSNKLFIGHLISGRLDAGSLHPATMTSAGYSVSVCMDRMLRLSDMACTSALGTIVGWGSSNSMLSGQGFSSTTLAQNGGTTSASDTSHWFYQLVNGSLTSQAQKNIILDSLARQTVRSGIPAGSLGLGVANKAGISGMSVFDSAIVYHPRGSYILSVMSDGGSFGAIAELTAQINKVLSE